MAGSHQGLRKLVFLTTFSALLGATKAATVVYNFRVEYAFRPVDCATKPIYVVNGQYPGPTITATEGDTVIVNVQNALFTEATSIHYHGLYQKGTPFYDGSGSGSQCPIPAGGSFTYKFSTKGQAGTFWWHSHYALQRSNGLYGLFIINPKPSAVSEKVLMGYDKDLEPMLLNDWWHKDSIEQQLGLVQVLPNPFIFVGNPQSLLINGKGIFNCSDTANLFGLACDNTAPTCTYPVFEVEKGKKYRIRLVSVTALSYLSFALEGHKITVVAADGSYTEPLQLSELDINSGQTYSVVFTANQPVANYWITTHIRHRAVGPTGAAILRYKGAPIASPATPIPSTFPAWNDTAYSIAQQRQIRTLKRSVKRVPKATRELVLVGTQNRINGRLVWAVNNQSYVLGATPYLLQKYYGLNNFPDLRNFDKPAVTWNYTQPLVAEGISSEAKLGSIVYNVPLRSVVQIVLQNTLALNNVSEQHPWHLHGHDFWVLGWGNGVYDPARDRKSFNLVNPIKRNTVTVYPAGWVAIRYLADNPGYWPFHCHIVVHLVMGMQVAILEGAEKLPQLPANFPTCGAITNDLIKTGPVFP